MTNIYLMLGAMLVEITFGWPRQVYRFIRHPVVWIGALVSTMEKRLNKTSHSNGARYFSGVVTVFVVVSISTFCAMTVSRYLPDTWIAYVTETIIAASLLATRSLYCHVNDVARQLLVGDLDAARMAVSHIVGRDPTTLDAAAISRASLETLADNASDGVVAPLFWGVIFGLPGIAAYKAVNTLDSMIGHKNSRYQSFGWASARLDDLANLIPARLTAIFIILASGSPRAISVVGTDAPKHRSPNAGWPESALAGSLCIRLSGPRSYGGTRSSEAWINEACPDPDANDVRSGLRLYLVAMALVAVVLSTIVMIGRFA